MQPPQAVCSNVPRMSSGRFVELVKIRAENGDIKGAKNAINSLAGSALQKKAAEVVALIQAHDGDLSGALETIAPFGQSDEVFLAYGGHQIETGDFEGALDTAGRTKSGVGLSTLLRHRRAAR